MDGAAEPHEKNQADTVADWHLAHAAGGVFLRQFLRVALLVHAMACGALPALPGLAQDAVLAGPPLALHTHQKP